MKYLVLLLFIITLILSIILYKVKGLLILIITIPLLIMYYKINLTKKKKSVDIENISEGKEVEVVKSRGRTKKINFKKILEKINIKKTSKTKKLSLFLASP